eukprot:maker-scaffold2600_size14039-snap-gene-0.0 protein:Tk12320 transcript:maker-scaffold2600_size14039-snap-gene-0.0-mRNA-1 annotation:"prolyl-trna synthetase"
MDKAGALETLLPMVQPAELWKESGRWNDYGPELLRFQDRHKRDFCLGPTHEEVITNIVKNDIRSYRQLPLNLYQIQTKFRDEIRPRFGLMRGREFIMKDAYSFDIDEQAMQDVYDKMYQAYCNIFDRLGLNYSAVEADNGSIGGNSSHEFHVLADSGEDDIAYNKALNYAANIEKVPAPLPTTTRADASQIPVYADHSVIVMSDFICGANVSGKHYTGANWERDAKTPSAADIREVVDGELCPGATNGETISICKGIEVGHIFQLGQKYSQSIDAYCSDESGEKVHYHMGCYGVGVSRIVAAAIEQNNDENGITWPEAMAPFDITIITIGYHKSELVKATADKMYADLQAKGYDVLLDDRNERPGIMFKDMELIGIPHHII